MGGVGAFELVSKPAPLTVTRSLQLAITTRGALARGSHVSKLSSALSLSIINETAATVALPDLLAGGQVRFETRGDDAVPYVPTDNASGALTPLSPGKALRIDLSRGTWQVPKTGDTVELRAIYHVFEKGSMTGTLYSDWITIPLR
jgi:hypothetical protein